MLNYIYRNIYSISICYSNLHVYKTTTKLLLLIVFTWHPWKLTTLYSHGGFRSFKTYYLMCAFKEKMIISVW